MWPDDDDHTVDEGDDNDGCQLHCMSTGTQSLLTEAFAKTVPNSTRRHWRKTYGVPASDMTKCPKLDNTLRTQIPKDGKDADWTLCRLQAMILDAVGPLASLLEMNQAGRLTPEAATQALRFLGNAHSHISTERRRRIVAFLNKDLQPLVEEPDRFLTAAPLLFRRDFEKSARDHVDSVKSIMKLSAPNGGYKQQFFRQGRPHNFSQAARGGGAFRGGSRNAGRGRFRPCQTGLLLSHVQCKPCEARE